MRRRFVYWSAAVLGGAIALVATSRTNPGSAVAVPSHDPDAGDPDGGFPDAEIPDGGLPEGGADAEPTVH